MTTEKRNSPVSDAANKILALLCDQLNAIGVGARNAALVLHHSRWPSARIEIGHLYQEPLLCRAEISVALNEKQARSTIYSYAVGIGNDADAALMDTTKQWIEGVAPPILSLLYQKPSFGAEWYPSGSLCGFDGWDSFAGPLMLRGEQELFPTTAELLDRHPLVEPVRDAISAALDPSALFETVSLFLAHSTTDQVFAEVRIGAVVHSDITETLKRFPLWRPVGKHISVRQFFFCMSVAETRCGHTRLHQRS